MFVKGMEKLVVWRFGTDVVKLKFRARSMLMCEQD